MDIHPEKGLVVYVVIMFYILKGTSVLLSVAAKSIYISTNSVQGFQYLHLISLFCNSYPNKFKIHLICVFLIEVEYLPVYRLDFVCLLWWNVYASSLPLFNWVICWGEGHCFCVTAIFWKYVWLANIFSCPIDCQLTFLMVSSLVYSILVWCSPT